MTGQHSSQTERTKRGIRNTVISLLVIVALVFSAVIIRTVMAKPDLAEALRDHNAYWLEPAQAVPEVVFTDHTGESFASTEFQGQWHVISFGYTHCLNDCPDTLADMAQAYETLKQQGLADAVRMWLVTVDPNRDDAQTLARYLTRYNETFVGLTGNKSDIKAFAEQLNTTFYIEGGEAQAQYTVVHNNNLAVLNPNGDYVAMLRSPLSPEQISAVMTLLMNQAS